MFRKEKRFRYLIVLSILFLLSNVIFAGDGVDSEPNNSYSQAEAITFRDSGTDMVTSAVGKISTSGDEDWYSIALPEGQYSVTLTNNDVSGTSTIFGELPADYDLYIYHYSDTSNYVVRAFAAGTTAEHLTFTVPAENDEDTYYIRVDGYLTAYDATDPYKMFMSLGDTEMLLEGFRYKLFPISFYGRQSSGTEYHSVGVAYSYGIKDTLSMYVDKMDEADTNKTTPQDNWSDYDDDYPRPGRKSTDDGGIVYDDDWAGIDCSGFIYRLAEVSSIDYYSVENRSAYNCGTVHFLQETDSTETTMGALTIGDVVQDEDRETPTLGHIMMISRLAEDFDDLYVMHADGKLASRTIFEEDINLARSICDTDYLYKLDLD